MADVKDKDDIYTGCVCAVIGLLLTPFSAIWVGYVISTLWGWFAVPVFHAPLVSIPNAIGLICLLGLLRGHRDTTRDQTYVELLSGKIAVVIVYPGTAILIGYAAKQFV